MTERLKDVPELRRKIRQDAEQDMYRRQEYQLPHNSYEYSERLISAIMENRIDDLLAELPAGLAQNYDEEGNGWEPGRLADEPVRNIKNLCFSIILNIVYRLAKDDAVRYEFITTLADAGVRELERAEDIPEVFSVTLATVQELVEQFGGDEAVRGYHPLVRRAKDYIYQRLHQKIVIGDMAKDLGTTASYLSQLFRKYEGCTVQEFILHERLLRAKQLLALSDQSVRDICSSLGFSSESYFGQCLKKDTGLTPREYRNRYNDQYRYSIPKDIK